MSEIRVDTISEKTSANGVAVDGVTIKDGGIAATAASTITTADNTAQLTLKSTDADASVGPDFVLQRDSGSPADDDSLGRIRFVADNDAGEALDHISINASIRDASDGTEDAQLTFNMLTAGAVVDAFHISPTETVFNDASADRNFRIESNDNAVMFVVDGENNRVGIGTNTPDMLLDVTGVISAGAGTDEDLQQWNIGSDNVKAKMTYLDASANRGFAIGTSSQHDFFLRTDNNIGLKVDINGAVTKPLQPAFLGINSAQQSDIADGHVLIDIDTEIFDQNADFNTGTHTFTAPVTGKYAFMVNITVSDLATNYQWVYCYIGTSNRTAFVSTIDPRSLATASGYSLGGSILIDMDANDTALLYFRSSAHGDNTVNIVSAGTTNAETYFSGYLVA